MRIWKWQLKPLDEQTVEMPSGAKILTVQTQNSECCIWALCDETDSLESRTITIYGTENLLPENPGEYIGTFQMNNGSLVLHVFEIK